MNPVEQARQTAFQETLLSARTSMDIGEILKLALDSCRASKVRFALTALGMVIGTASVIWVVTIGMTGSQYILSQLKRSRQTPSSWNTPEAEQPQPSEYFTTTR